MMITSVSVIVPIYNSEKFLCECLQSIANQTFDKFEVILVDDGSNDSSKDICLEFLKNDNRFKYFYKENGGSASARNYGLNLVKGKYVVFVDSDDMISLNLFEECFGYAEKYNMDCVRFKVSDKYTKYANIKNINIFSKIETFSYYNSNNAEQGVCFGFYNSNLLDDIRFTEKVRIGEDYEFLMNLIDKAQNIALLDLKGYFYRRNSGSVCHLGYRNDTPLYINNYKKVYETFSLRYPNISNLFLNYYCIQLLAVPVAMTKSRVFDFEFLNFIKQELIQYSKVFVKDKSVKIYYKISLVLFCLNPCFFVVMYIIFVHWWRDK